MESLSDANALKSNFIWNTFGNVFYLFTQWLLAIIIVRIDNAYATAGLLSLCMTIGNVGLVAACYNIRAYQVSDIDDRFSQSDYFTNRVINCIITVFSTVLFCAVVRYDFSTSSAVTAYALFKITEALADLYYGVAQKHDRMDYVGKSYILKGISTSFTFILFYYIFRNLLLAISVMFLVSLAITQLYDSKNARMFTKLAIAKNIRTYYKLLSVCFSPFVYGVCIAVIPAIPRLYLEQNQGKEMLGIYSSIAMPAVIVQTSIALLFAPLITFFSRYYKNKDMKFIKLFALVLFLVALLGVVSTLVISRIGKEILVFLYNQDIAEYTRVFTTAIVSSFLTGLVWFLFMILTVMRKMKTIFVGSLTGVLVIIISTVIGMPAYGIDGVNYILIIVYVQMSLLAFSAIAFSIKRHMSIRQVGIGITEDLGNQ